MRKKVGGGGGNPRRMAREGGTALLYSRGKSSLLCIDRKRKVTG